MYGHEAILVVLFGRANAAKSDMTSGRRRVAATARARRIVLAHGVDGAEKRAAAMDPPRRRGIAGLETETGAERIDRRALRIVIGLVEIVAPLTDIAGHVDEP